MLDDITVVDSIYLITGLSTGITYATQPGQFLVIFPQRLFLCFRWNAVSRIFAFMQLFS